LDSYAAERQKTAQSLITNVGTATKIVTLKKPLVQKLRNQLAGLVLNTDLVRNRMGRGVAMLDIAYKDSPVVAQDLQSSNWTTQVFGGFKSLLSQARYDFEAGPTAGMRAPNVIMMAESAKLPTSLFDLYRGTHYTLMIFAGVVDSPGTEHLLQIGAAVETQYQAAIRFYVVTVELSFPLHGQGHIILDPDKSIHRAYASWEPSLYLIRPDKYIAYRSQTIDQNRLASYLDRMLVRNPLDGKE
jgi:hypothetical protein